LKALFGVLVRREVCTLVLPLDELDAVQEADAAHVADRDASSRRSALFHFRNAHARILVRSAHFEYPGMPSLVVASSSKSDSGEADLEQDDRGVVTALARGLEILSCFRFGESTLSNTELAQRCGLPKSTVSRLAHTLTKLGYLINVPATGRYRLGTSCLALGSAMLTRFDVRTIARPMMQELATATGLSVSLCVPHQLSMIYLDHCRSVQTLSLTLAVGSRIPVATSAVGRAWIASLPAAERAACMRQIEAADPASWRAVREGIEKALQEYEQVGIASSFGDWKKEVVGIARAFSPGNGLPNMAVSLGGAADNAAPDLLMKDGAPRLIELVSNLESLLHRGVR
jgi:DNA-binding IclR family transcriptional regulator